MGSDIFKAGVAPGSPASEDEVKMLLCYILAGIGQAISFEQLYGAMDEHSLINYFELTQVMRKLVRQGHISVSGSEPELYSATELGRETASEFERSLPLSVREKALLATRRLLSRERRLREVRVEQVPAGGGYMLELAIPDMGEDLMSIRVYLPTTEHCELMRKRFLNAPLAVYRGVMALLAGGEDILGDVPAQDEELF